MLLLRIFLLGLSFNGLLRAELWFGRDIEQLAVIKDPVVDVFINVPLPIDIVPASPQSKVNGCRRAHQCLFNEVVTCIAREGSLVKIACENVIYGLDDVTGVPLNSFWITEDHLLFLKDMKQEQRAAIPQEMNFDVDKKGLLRDENAYMIEPQTLVLTFPWNEFSLGTRFVRVADYDSAQEYAVKMNTRANEIPALMAIPKQLCRLEKALSLQQARIEFVMVLNQLVDRIEQLYPQVIPYVWGGSSFVHEYQDLLFYEHGGVWERPEKYSVYTGYDCSEFILRLAQMSGVPYLFKTTRVLEQCAQELKIGDTLQEGDLIWMPGHVMIVSNIPRNEIIEARSYSSGFGKVQRLSLKECFEGITTYADLQDACFAKKTLKMLNKEGSPVSDKQCKLLKLYRE